MTSDSAEKNLARTGRKGILGWMMFDWAAQPFHTLIVTFAFAPYFTGYVASDSVTGQAQWGYAAAVAGVLIAILSPVLGAIADATGPRKPWLFGFSVLAVIGSFGLWWAIPGGDPSTVLLTLVLFGITMIGFEFAAVFNNAMMPTLVPRTELGRLSGNAWALGYVGGLVSLVIVLLTMVSNEEGKTLIGIDPMFGLEAAMREGERATGPLTAIWYILFVIPLFLYTPDTQRRARVTGAIQTGIAEIGQTLRDLPSNRSLFAYLGSSMFYRDALNGLYAFGGIYAQGVLGWSIVQVGIFGILAATIGTLGAAFGGRMDDRFGPKAVIVTCMILLIVTSLTVITTGRGEVFLIKLADTNSSLPDIVFYICGGAIGAAGGALQAASRTLMVDQSEPGKETEAFGLYALSGKATAFIAPALIALATDWSGSQRVGVSPIVALFVIALLLLPFVKQFNPETGAKE